MQFLFAACECIGGLLASSNAAILPLLLVGAAISPATAGLPRGQKALLWAGAGLTALPWLWYLVRFYLSVIRHEFPVSLAVALHHPRLPLLLRIPLMLYWLLLGLLATVAAATYEWAAKAGGSKMGIEMFLTIVLMSAICAYAARSFLLLAIHAVRYRQDDVMVAWRRRHWLTMGIVLCSVLLALLV